MILFRPGKILCISDGEYSDYRLRMLVVVVKEFAAEEAEEAFKQSGLPLENDDDPFDEFKGFRDWLIQEGYVVPLAAGEWSVGAYRKFDHWCNAQIGDAEENGQT